MSTQENRDFWETMERASRRVACWPSWKAGHCTCEARRRAKLEQRAAELEMIAAWLTGDGADAQRVALADGVREGRWITNAQGLDLDEE